MIAQQKANLRQETVRKISLLSHKEKQEESDDICKALLPIIPPTMTVCGFAPLPDEPDITPLLTSLIEHGNAVYLPRYANGIVTFLRAEDLAQLRLGQGNILEPPEDATPLENRLVDIVLVPGRAFDKKGNRLGRGAGGYDTWIATARMRSGTLQCIGVAFDCQIVVNVPTEPHDQRMDALATRSGYRVI